MNRALTTLVLRYNDVGDAGAAALAKALKATVFDVFIVSVQGVPVVAKDVTSHGANSWRRQVVVKCALRLLCLSCGLKISIHLCVWFSKLVWPGSRFDWVGGVLSCTRRASPRAFAKLHTTTSFYQGLCVRLANEDRAAI